MYPFSRLEISCPTASSDALYHCRYPHGDAPSQPTLSGAAVSAVTAPAQLTTHIKVAAAALDAISAAAALSAQIRLNAAANDTTSAAAVLPLGMATTAIGPANYNKATTLPVLASGGATPYTYSILSQSGPDTWSINSSTGVLSATPAVPSLLVTGGGQYILDGNGFPIFASATSDSVTVQAQDAHGVTVQRTFTIALQSALVLTSTLPGGTQSSAYSQTLTASGGASPYTWKLLKATSGSNTYALSSSGVLTGTPTVADTDTMTILCVDANGVPQSESLSIVVAVSGTVPTQVTGAAAFLATSPGVVEVRFAPPSNYNALVTAGFPVQSYTAVLSGSGGSQTTVPFIVDQNNAPCCSFVGTIASGSNVITGITTKNTTLTVGDTLVDRYGYVTGRTVSALGGSSGAWTVTFSGAAASGSDTYQRIGFNHSGKAQVWSQLNKKVTITGVAPGTYTATVYATNANGNGSASSATASVTVAASAAFYFFDGPGCAAPTSGGSTGGTNNGIGFANASVVGNHDFGNSGFFSQYWVAPGTTSHNGLSSAPTNPLDSTKNVWECNGISGSSGASQSYVTQAFPSLPGNNQNGDLPMANFSKFLFSVYPQSSQPIGFYINPPFIAPSIDGVVTSVSGATITDNTLALPAGTPSGGAVGGGAASGFGLANISNPQWASTGTANTATTITTSSTLTWTVGDFYSVSIGDIPCGTGINNMGNGSVPSGGTGPTTMSHGAWNVYTLPLTALDGPIDSVTTAFPIVSSGRLFKISLAMNPPAGASNWYLSNVGFSP